MDQKRKKNMNRPRTITYTNIIPLHRHQLDKVIFERHIIIATKYLRYLGKI